MQIGSWGLDANSIMKYNIWVNIRLQVDFSPTKLLLLCFVFYSSCVRLSLQVLQLLSTIQRLTGNSNCQSANGCLSLCMSLQYLTSNLFCEL